MDADPMDECDRRCMVRGPPEAGRPKVCDFPSMVDLMRQLVESDDPSAPAAAATNPDYTACADVEDALRGHVVRGACADATVQCSLDDAFSMMRDLLGAGASDAAATRAAVASDPRYAACVAAARSVRARLGECAAPP